MSVSDAVRDSLSPLSASVVDGQLLSDALLGFKSVPVHLRLFQRAHLLFLSSDTVQDARHACRPFGTTNTRGGVIR